jgi:hypothetical protein
MDKIIVTIIISLVLLLFVSCERENKDKYEVVFVYHNEQEVLILNKQYGDVVRVDIKDNTEEALKAREEKENTNTTEDEFTEVTTEAAPEVVADSVSVGPAEPKTISDAITDREKKGIKSLPSETKYKVGDWVKIINIPNRLHWLNYTDKRVFKLTRYTVFQDEIIWYTDGLGDKNKVYDINEIDFRKATRYEIPKD